MAEASFAGVDEKTISTYLDRSQFDYRARSFVDLAFTAADQIKGKPGRLARTDRRQFCEYVYEIADLVR
jgi:hypothetical protein